MLMTAFHALFPDIGGSEYRVVELPRVMRGLPPGAYGFVELYCTDAACGCRNLHLNVEGGDPPAHLATINFSLDPEGFADLGLDQCFLDPINVQSRFSQALLDLFREILMGDAVYLERLERHMAMAKTAGAGWQAAPRA